MSEQSARVWVSVVICTRDRGALISDTIESILAGSRLPEEIVVIDQSVGRETETVVTNLATVHAGGFSGTVRHIPSTTRGLSAARNVGVAAAQGSIIVFVDDDCEAKPAWIGSIVGVFEEHAEVCLIAGSVAPPEGFDWSTGYVPNIEMTEGSSLRHPYIMGANMALRRSVLNDLGPFDETLGAGSPGQSCEDMDYLLRVYGKYGRGRVYGIGEPLIVHQEGGRFGDARRGIIEAYGYGEGALIGKLLRLRDRQFVPYVTLIFGNYVKSIFSWLIRRSGSSGLRRARRMARGICYGVREAGRASRA